jgi:GDP-L-fucose synthase
MTGQALIARLREANYTDLHTPTHAALDLCDRHAVRDFLSRHTIDGIFLLAAKTAGIRANAEQPIAFLQENARIALNVIEEAARAEVPRLVYVASSCVYPRAAPQPMPEEAVFSGPLEPTIEGFGFAKLLGLKLCALYHAQGRHFVTAVPGNLYGPHDAFLASDGPVVSALLRRIHRAKIMRAESVEIWGTGNARREFLHVADFSDALLFLMNGSGKDATLNVGTGADVSIGELAEAIARIIGYSGKLMFNAEKPEGAPRKLLDTHRLRVMGWKARIPLPEGLREVYAWALRAGVLTEPPR